MRSTFSWFAEICHSQRLSHLAASFIVAWAETSIAKSCKVMLISFKKKSRLKKFPTWELTKMPSVAEACPHKSPLLTLLGNPNAVKFRFDCEIRIIDPSAGSPTETLLRLLLPLSNKVNLTFQRLNELPRKLSVRNIHRIAQSVGATGGVYKGQGRNHDGLMNHHY